MWLGSEDGHVHVFSDCAKGKRRKKFAHGSPVLAITCVSLSVQE